ncbi:MAG: restriction endonuclease subunit S [Natronospirillum sp.]
MTVAQVADVSPKYLVEAAGNAVPLGCKQTEVGVIPEDWDTPKFGEMCTLINGRGFKPHEWSIEGLPIIRIQNLNGSEEFNHYQGHYDPKIFVQNGQLLFAWSGSRGTSFGPHIWHGGNALLNYHTWKLVIRDQNIDADYFFHILKQLTKQIEESAHGASALVHTQKGEMENFFVPLPKRRQEQTAIANALSDVDALISKLEKLIAKKQAIKTATMQQLLTGRTRLPQFTLRENGTKKGTKPSELGEIPEDWDAIKMGNLAKIQRGASPRPIDSPIWFERNSTVGWLRISDASKTHKYLMETTQSLSELGIANSRFVPENNLVMSICATVGKPIITKKDLCIHDGFVVFNGLSVNQDYMYYILKELEDEWSKQGQTGSQMNLNTDLINGTYVAIPQIDEEQITIATILSEMDEEIQALEQRLGKTRQIKQGMMQELLTGKTRLVQPRNKECQHG